MNRIRTIYLVICLLMVGGLAYASYSGSRMLNVFGASTWRSGATHNHK